MLRRTLFACMFVGCAAFATAQDVKPKQPADAEPPVRLRGVLPQYWKQLGLSDDQVQQIYKIQATYNEEIEKLEEQIKALKEKMAKERSAVLTKEQKERLEKIIKDKIGGN